MESSSLLLGDVVFDAKPDAVPFNYRISYKVTQLCLIMRICGWRDASSSLIKLHMISFALFSRENMKNLIEFTKGTESAPIVRFDPAVNRALTYAIAYGFIEQQPSGNFVLTDQGKKLADQIILVDDLMVTEISCLNDLKKKLTENSIKELIETWREKHAED